MVLKEIEFVAFKSLLNQKLIINENCIGFVGINESGKSNVLTAIRVLSDERKLSSNDIPRMAKDRNPEMVFTFSLSEDEISNINLVFKNWINNYIQDYNDNVFKERTINYHIKFDKETEKEIRCFEYPDIEINKGYLVLIPEKYTKELKLIKDNLLKAVDECIVISKIDLQENEKMEQKIVECKDVEAYIKTRQTEIVTFHGEESDGTPGLSEEEIRTNERIASEIEEHEEKLKSLRITLKNYPRQEILKNFQKKYNDLKNEIDADGKNKNALILEIKSLESIQNLTPQQTKQLSDSKEAMEKYEGSLASKREKLARLGATVNLLEENVIDKYTDNKEIFFHYIEKELDTFLFSVSPKVIFWEYSDKYLQRPEISFDEILNENDLNDISRPLVNIFRIGMGIDTIDDLKSVIKESRNEITERNRIQKKLTNEINKFLKNIWSDYDQAFQIDLESDRLRVLISDPKNEGAGYYTMQERSQGCQTFISFLLTIGAEAQHGVLKNSILLLDEPETHLHPSGVRYMLQELIKIAQNNNIVFYATHSIFMIDRKNFRRHFIIKKEKELTYINNVYNERLGYFMQEEVLYATLDVNLGQDFDSAQQYNFVFEGDGDGLLFEYFYNKLPKKEKPFDKDCSFFHGGKCSDIKHFLLSKPIQLGTKWIFVLDSDKPANDLRDFISGKYKSYIDKDIFIFQYSLDGLDEVELEDLLPDDIKFGVYCKILSDVELLREDYDKEIKDVKGFSNQFNKICTLYNHEISTSKGIFKQNLNMMLMLHVKENDLKDKYNCYFTWFNKMINNVQTKIKSDTETKRNNKIDKGDINVLSGS